VQGDTVYLFDRQDFGIGIGWNIASLFDGIMELRAETVFPVVGDGSTTTLVGPGVGFNIPKAIEKLGGEWLLPSITSSIGVLGLWDFNAADGEDDFQPAIYLTILKVTF
jgi:hypothetical protein